MTKKAPPDLVNNESLQDRIRSTGSLRSREDHLKALKVDGNSGGKDLQADYFSLYIFYSTVVLDSWRVLFLGASCYAASLRLEICSVK